MGYKIKKAWAKQKPLFAELNFSNPLLDKIVCCVPFWEGAGNPRNILKNSKSTVVGTLGWSTGHFGLTRDITPIGGSNTESFSMTSNVDWQHGPFTVMVLITFRSFQTLSPNISGVFSNTGSGGNFCLIRLNDGGHANNSINYVVTGSGFSGSALLTANVPYQLLMTYDGTTLAGFVNGAQDGTSAISPTAGAGGSTAMFWRDDSTGRGPDAKAHLALIWRRVLKNSEIKELYTSPFDIFNFSTRRSPSRFAIATGNLNTRSKRSSAIGIDLVVPHVWPNPDATLDQADRQQMAMKYSGILATGPSISSMRTSLLPLLGVG